MFWRQKRGTVFVGLSGGVDSAVSAALLKQQGYDVIGVFIRIVLPGYPCTAGEDRREALRVATHLHIPFREIDLSDAYMRTVFTPSIAAFAEGKTPNPDAWCNREIKFGLFYNYAREQGADYVATGHYARVLRTKHQFGLFASIDTKKDQSYFLWSIPYAQLPHILFPIGMFKKEKVRQLAKRFHLPNAARKDSQGLCFVGDLGIEQILTKEQPQYPGKVLDEKGNEIGVHAGAMLYTIGQRHGFTLHARTTHTQPHFVVRKDIAHNTITVSERKIPTMYSSTRLILTQTNWIGNAPEEGQYMVRFRYRQPLMPAFIHYADDTTLVTLQQPQLVPEGQSLVVYKENQCIGGGVVDKVEMEA